MNNIFLSTLTTEQRAALDIGNISYADLSLGDESGLLIEESQLERVLQVLNCTVSTLVDSGFEGIKKATLIGAHPTNRGNGNARATADFVGADHLVLTASRLLVPYLGRNVELHFPNNVAAPISAATHDQIAKRAYELWERSGRLAYRQWRTHEHWLEAERELQTKSVFHIHIYSSPKSCEAGVQTPALIYGIPVDCRDTAWPASGQGTPIIDPDTRYVVAELVGQNNLYVHHKLAACGSDYEQAIFWRLLQDVLPLLERPRQDRRVHRQLFIEECSKSTGRGLAPGRADVRRVQRIKEVQKELGKKLRAARLNEEKLLLNQRLLTAKDLFGQEYEALLRIPKVKDVQVEGYNIIVLTDTLCCKDDRTGVVHEIGAFRIELPLNGTSPRWLNQTRRVTGMKSSQNAPHVWSDGSACLGNTGDLFYTLLRDRQFAIAAQLAIEFIEQANTSDPAGKYVNNWPRADGGWFF